jgi:RNA polymerase sigma-70 factor (ECF subfamily)
MGPRPGTETSGANPSPGMGGALCVPVADGDRSRVRQRPSLDFRRIFDSQGPAVSRTLRYLGVPEADLMDAAQEVFLVVNRRFGEFEGRSTLSTWIRQICLRVAFTYRRRRGRRREDVLADPPESVVDADQQAGLERREQRALLNRLLDSLDDDQRAVVVLYEIELLPMREVAETVGCPLQTAYSRRKAGLERLRAAMAEVEEGTP